MVRYAIVKYSGVGGWVEDPFAGSGTACVESLLTGRNCLAMDINPLTEFLVRVKTLALPVGVRDARREVRRALDEAMSYGGEPFRPDWGRALYWYREDVFEELCRLWGFVHSIREEYVRLILSVGLLKVSRRFSFTDDQIPKLYRSKVKAERIKELLSGDWRSRMREMFRSEAMKAFKKVAKLNKLMKRREWPEVRVVTGVDAASTDPPIRADLVITSPPYLIAHEYFRSTKLELYWLGYSEKEVKRLARKEIPYNKPPKTAIKSRTYLEYRDKVAAKKPHLLRYYDTYFHTILTALQRHSPRQGGVMTVFIGPATLAGIPIPVHDIIREHFEANGYEHIETLIDAIAARKIFTGRKNNNPNGITHEYLLIMRAS